MATHALDAVHINGFRWLRNLRLNALGRVNLLVGRNNSGKTSVLEALSILSNPLYPLEWLNVIRRRDFGGLDESRTQSLRWCLRQSGDGAAQDEGELGGCEMSCRGRFEIPALVVTMREIVGEPLEEETHRTTQGRRVRRGEPELQRGVEVSHRVRIASSELLQVTGTGSWVQESVPIWERAFYATSRRSPAPGLATETLSPYAYQINRFQVRNLSRSIRAGHHREIVSLIQVFDPEIENIDVLSLTGDRPAVYLTHRRLGIAPLSVFGDAVRRICLLASSITHLKDGLLLIDEIETGMHVSTLPSVFEWLHAAAERHGVQVIATTHSLEAVDAMIGVRRTGNDEDAVAFHLDQEEDVTAVKRFDFALLARLRFERGLDVR